MPVVIDVAAQDFPDAAQRFNWCSCQREAPALTARLGQVTPDALPGGSLPVTPIFDFSFWEQQLTGGGGGMPTSQTGGPYISPAGALAIAGSAASWLLPGALLIGGLWFLTSRKKRGRR